MFIEPVFAESHASIGADPTINILMLVGFVVIFYFLLWRPQQKRQKEHKNLIENLSKGDEVATGGGLMGRITKVGDDAVSLEIHEGVVVQIQKSSVVLLLPKGTLKEQKAA